MRAQFEVLTDPILAYEFKYPTESLSGTPIRMVLAHVPEKYSSAAPLTADARQVGCGCAWAEERQSSRLKVAQVFLPLSVIGHLYKHLASLI
jgi:hypothetical protein